MQPEIPISRTLEYRFFETPKTRNKSRVPFLSITSLPSICPIRRFLKPFSVSLGATLKNSRDSTVERLQTAEKLLLAVTRKMEKEKQTNIEIGNLP